MMLAMATAATMLVDWSDAPMAIKLLVHTIRLTTAAGLIGLGLVFAVPALSGEWVRNLIARVPLVGATAARLIGAVRTYRDAKRHLLLAAGLCLVVDTLFISSFYLVARGLPVHAPTYVQHFVIIPVANLVGAIPATPSGLGTLEAAVDALYQTVPGQTTIPPGDGTLVALAQRMTMIIRRAGRIGVLHDAADRPPRGDPRSRGSRRLRRGVVITP
jgi:uncharacterized membrane protein YbhN (UPF0104 family)